MANKNIQIQDVQGNNLFPKTLGKVVFNDNNENLGGVEAGAQVNKIETIKLNGVELAINAKVVDIVLPAAIEYTIVKAETADEGMAATYQLAKDGVAFGQKINIAKDMFVESGTVETCTEADKPIAGLKVGDKYIDLVLANKEDQHLYIPANALVDVYTQGTGIIIEDHQVKIDDTVVCTVAKLEAELAKKQDNFTVEEAAAAHSGITAEKVAKYDGYEATIAEKQVQLTPAQLLAVNSGIDATTKAAYDTHVADTVKHITAEERTAWNAKQVALDATQMAAVNSGIDATAKAKYDAYETGKANVATTLSGYGITDGLTYVELA